jgi:hypothetical protein
MEFENGLAASLPCLPSPLSSSGSSLDPFLSVLPAGRQTVERVQTCSKAFIVYILYQTKLVGAYCTCAIHMAQTGEIPFLR